MEEIEFQKSLKAKNIRIKIKENKVIVIYPFLVPLVFVKKFVKEKQKWIERTLEKRSKQKKLLHSFSKNSVYHLPNKILEIEFLDVRKIKTEYFEKKITIKVPNENISEIKIEKYFEKILKKESEIYLEKKIKYFAEKYSFKYNNLKIRKLKSRWGSCTSLNDITLSLYLILLPDDLVDYVVLHELCHTIEKNHRKGFYKLLDSVIDDRKEKEKRLKNYKF